MTELHRLRDNNLAALRYISEVTDALWDAEQLSLSARQIGTLEDVIRVASDHGLHRRSFTHLGARTCVICDSYKRLEEATAEAVAG